MTTLKRVAVLGEIGAGNLGDDLGYVLLARELRAAFDDLDVLVDIRPMTPNLFGLLGGYHWDAVVTGVGTLLDRVNGTYVQALVTCAQRCPVAVLGTGINGPKQCPPTPAGRLALDELLWKHARHVWLRGESGESGVDNPAYFAPDPLWLLGFPDGLPAASERPEIGFNLGYAGYCEGNFDPELVMVLRAARLLVQRPSRLFAAWANDMPWTQRLIQQGEEVYLVDGTRGSLALLDHCAAVFCTRIHLGVVAACRGAFPVLPDYAPKVRSVFANTEVPRLVLDTRSTAEDVAVALSWDAPPQEAFVESVRAAQAITRERVRTAAMAITRAW